MPTSLIENPSKRYANEFNVTTEGLQGDEVSIKQTNPIQEIVDFTQKVSYSFTQPISVTYYGDTHYVTSWRNVYICVCQLLCKDYPTEFKNLRDTRGVGEYKLIYDSGNSKKLTTPFEITNGIYIETNRSASCLIDHIKMLIDYCKVDYTNVIIRYVKKKNNTEHIDSKSKQENDKEIREFNEFRKWLRAKRGHGDATIDFMINVLKKTSDIAHLQGYFLDPLIIIDDADLIKQVNNCIDKTLFQQIIKNKHH